MANVAFTMSPAPGVINDMIAVLYDGAAEVDRLDIPAPHDSPVDLDFINVAAKTYNVKIHETPGGGVLGNLRHDFWVDASLQKLSGYTVKTFQVGAGRGAPYYDPADQDDEYINPDIDGLDYLVFKPGFGPLDWAANITPHTGGGFDFTDGQKFDQDAIYTLLISNLVTQPLQQTGVGYPSDIVTISADTAFSSTHYNNLIEVDASAAVITITIATIATIPDGTIFGINTQKHNGTLRNVVLQLPAATSCYVNGVARNAVYIGRSEEVTFVKKGSILRIVNWDGDYRRLGEKVFSDGDAPANGLLCDGTWYNKTDIPRGYNWYINVLPAGEWVSGVDDSTPAGDDVYKWIIGTNKVRTPDHRDMHYRAANGSRIANSYQADAVGPGTIKTRVFTGNGLTKNGLPGGTPGVGILGTMGDGGSITTDSASGTNNNSAHTDPWDIISTSGETRVKNIAQNVYVII